jgi:acyl carrier protein
MKSQLTGALTGGKNSLRMVIDTARQEKTRHVLAECLRFLAGKNCPADFTDDMIVLQACDLDSEHGIEIACDLSARLGIEIPAKDNPLISDDVATGRKRARSFDEVVTYLMTLTAT